MSGHSKWATTKHRKAAQDSKRSKIFSKLSRIITVAAKTGGDPNPENNAALAAAITKAKGYSLPKDKIDTAIKKAFGAGSEGTVFESVVYEGYGPAGVAVYVEALTDNRNRTAADVRAAFSHSGGNLGTTGSVAYMFERKGQIVVDKSAHSDEDELMLLVAEAGGDDLDDAGDEWIVWTDGGDLSAVSKALAESGVEIKGAELTFVPTTPAAVTVSDVKKVLNLVDKLEDLDDIQAVYHTMDITDDIAAQLEL